MSQILGHKVQLALAVLKGRRDELMKMHEVLDVDNLPQASGTMRLHISERTDKIDEEIDKIKERLVK